MSARGPRSGWVVLAGVVFLLTCAVTVRYGRLTLDEGFFLYTSADVLRGKLPYRDFLFLQAPLTAYLFAPVAVLGASSYLAGRALCAVLGAAAVLLAARAAARTAGPAASAWTVALLASNASFCFDVCSVKTAAPASIAVGGALFFLARTVAVPGTRKAQAAPSHRAWVPWCFAIGVLSLGTAARLSLAPALALVWGAGVLALWPSRRSLAGLTLAAALPAGGILGTFWLLAGDRLWFGVVAYHHLAFGTLTPEVSRLVVEHFVRGTLANQGLALLAGALAMAFWFRSLARVGWRVPALPPALRLAGLSLLVWWVVTLLHATRTMPYPTHQTMLLPLLAFSAGIVFASRWRTPAGARHLPLAVYVAALATVPFQEWPLRRGLEGGSLEGLGRAGSAIRELAVAGPLLTFDPSLAVAAEMRLVPGYELGMFAFLPHLPEVAHYRAKDEAGLHADLASGAASVVAFIDRDLEQLGRFPRIVEAVGRNYTPAKSLPRYGQFDQTLYLFRRKGASRAP